MTSKTFALMRRALQVETREVKPYLFRAALATVILTILWFTWMEPFSINAPGLRLFGWIAHLNYWFITFAGGSFFASTITEEKEERTLSLMKMAGVSPLSILLGNWLPQLSNAALLIAIQIPFTVLSITLGGVSWQQIVAVYVALFAHLLFVGNLGLLMSVLCNTTTTACGWTMFILFLFHFLPYPLQAGANELIVNGFLVTPMAWLSSVCGTLIDMTAMYRLYAALSTGFNDPALSFQVVSNVVAGVVLFGISWMIFEPCTRNEVEPGQSLPWHLGIGNLLKRRQASQPRRAWGWAIAWKDFTITSGGFPATIFKFILYSALILGFTWLSADNYNLFAASLKSLAGIAFAVAIPAAVIEFLVQTSRLYRAELSDKTWSTLCMLPYSIPKLAYSKLVGVLLSLWPALLWICFGILVIFPDFLEGLGEVFSRIEGIGAITYAVLQVLAGLHVAIYLSISTRWAIWPIALFSGGLIVMLINMLMMACLMGVFSGGGGDGLLAMLDFFWLCGVIFLHHLVLEKLEERAAES
ncbi:ABC transporter permease [Planctomicrobium sp. SH664]|uniref:ABC transporter permease n=1 Tax=Planctomicrobium sp. SH664 TaxID=3448125 RepID=UPI003F5C2F0B